MTHPKGPDTGATFFCNAIFLEGCHTMQFVARNVAKVELDSTSATVARKKSFNVCPGLRAVFN